MGSPPLDFFSIELRLGCYIPQIWDLSSKHPSKKGLLLALLPGALEQMQETPAVPGVRKESSAPDYAPYSQCIAASAVILDQACGGFSRGRGALERAETLRPFHAWVDRPRGSRQPAQSGRRWHG